MYVGIQKDLKNINVEKLLFYFFIFSFVLYPYLPMYREHARCLEDITIIFFSCFIILIKYNQDFNS